MSNERQKEGSNGKYGNYESSTSKMKQYEWDVQEVVRKAAKQWVDEANNNNVVRMLQENTKLNNTLVNLINKGTRNHHQKMKHGGSWWIAKSQYH